MPRGAFARNQSDGGWLEIFTQGDNADFFAPPILASGSPAIPAIAIFEVSTGLFAGG